MKSAFAVWKWSLGVVARSYRTVVALAALIALWVWAGYEWLALPESSALLLVLAFIWAVVQLLAAVAIVGGTVAGAGDAAASESGNLPLKSVWTIKRENLLEALIFFLISFGFVWLGSAVFGWINEHALEVASFLTFHSQKAVSHVPVEEVFTFIEGLLWMVIGGFLLSFLIVLLRSGWRGAAKQTGKLLAGCAFRTPFLTTLLSVAVFGGIAYELANWHPLVAPGFWDYTQIIARFTLVLILISAGVLFWSLSLARLILPPQNPPDVT